MILPDRLIYFIVKFVRQIINRNIDIHIKTKVIKYIFHLT